MNLQIIKSVQGQPEFVLLPMNIYKALKNEIREKLEAGEFDAEYVPFDPTDYVNNPVALARIKAGMTQQQLAKRMKVSQAYISKIERQEKISAKLFVKVQAALGKKK